MRRVATLRPKKGALRIRFHAFGHDSQAERTAEPDHRAHDRLGIRTVPQSSDKGSVDLDLVDRELSQPPQAGIAGPEVIDRDPNPLAVQSVAGH